MEPCVRRTQVKREAGGGAAGAPGSGRGHDRFLLDTIGELRQAYALADVVVVGRSFGDQFGSDPIEPVALGRATVIGPATSDFTSVVTTLRDAGALRQVTREGLAAALAELLGSPALRDEMAMKGAAAIRGEQGASQRHAELLLNLAGVSTRVAGLEGVAGGGGGPERGAGCVNPLK
jgi:3-deoxy-D-manno-octulosonic-acid transferase